MDIICGIAIIGVLVFQACMLVLIVRSMTPTLDSPVRVPEHNRRSDRRTPPGGYVNLEENDLKKAKNGGKK